MEYVSPIIEVTYFKSRDVVRASLTEGEEGSDNNDREPF